MTLHYILDLERKLEPVYIINGHDLVTFTLSNEKTMGCFKKKKVEAKRNNKGIFR